MELIPTTEQRLESVAQPYLQRIEEYPDWKGQGKRWLALIRHLEQNVDGPPQWVTVSMSRGCFYITEVDTWEICNTRVEIYLFYDRYEIRYRMPNEQAPWKNGRGSWVLGEAMSIEEAGYMITAALELAATNLPKTRTEWAERYDSG